MLRTESRCCKTYLVTKNTNARAQHIECGNKECVQIETHFCQLFCIQTGRGGFAVNTPASQVNARGRASAQRSLKFRNEKGGRITRARLESHRKSSHVDHAKKALRKTRDTHKRIHVEFQRCLTVQAA